MKNSESGGKGVATGKTTGKTTQKGLAAPTVGTAELFSGKASGLL